MSDREKLTRLTEEKEFHDIIRRLQEFRKKNAFDEMISLGKECLEKMASDENNCADQQIGTIYAAVVLAYLGKEEYAEAYNWCVRMLEDSKVNEFARAFALQIMTKSAFYLREYELSIESANAYLKYAVYFEEDKEKQIAAQNISFICETFDPVRVKDVYSILICSGLKLGSVENLEKYMDKLQWNENHIYVFEGIVDVLAEAMLTMEPHPAFVDIMKIIKNHSRLSIYFSERRQMVKYRLDEEEASRQREKRDEMSEIKTQILAQLQRMLENDQTENALQTVLQLKKMMPEDLDVAASVMEVLLK